MIELGPIVVRATSLSADANANALEVIAGSFGPSQMFMYFYGDLATRQKRRRETFLAWV
jgi:hypothetical protein